MDKKSIENGLEGQKFLVVCLFWGGCHHPNPHSFPENLTLDDYYTTWSDWSSCTEGQTTKSRTRGCKDNDDCPRLSDHMTHVEECHFEGIWGFRPNILSGLLD